MTEQEREHWEHEAAARYDDIRERFAGEEIDPFAGDENLIFEDDPQPPSPPVLPPPIPVNLDEVPF